MKYKQIPSIIGVVDRVGLNHTVSRDSLAIPHTIIGEAKYHLPLSPGRDEIQFIKRQLAVRKPAGIYNIPFFITETKSIWKVRINPIGLSKIKSICYFADAQFFEQLFAKRCTKEEQDYFIIGGEFGDYNMYCTELNLKQELKQLHDRIMARIKLCADRARAIVDKKKTYKEIPYVIPKSIAELHYLICYHKMTTDDLLVFATFLPKIVTHMDRIVKTQIMVLAEQYWTD